MSDLSQGANTALASVLPPAVTPELARLASDFQASANDARLIDALLDHITPDLTSWAKRVFQTVANQDQSLPGPYYGLAALAGRAGDSDQLTAMAVQAFRRDPKHAATAALVGDSKAAELVSRAGQYRTLDETVRHLEKSDSLSDSEKLSVLAKIISEAPDYWKAQAVYFKLAAKAKDEAAVWDMFHRLEPLQGRSPYLALSAAKALHALGRWEEMIDLCVRSLAELPRQIEALHLAYKAIDSNPALRPKVVTAIEKHRSRATDPTVFDLLLAPRASKSPPPGTAAPDERRELVRRPDPARRPRAGAARGRSRGIPKVPALGERQSGLPDLPRSGRGV